MIHYEFKTCISDGMELYGFVQEEPNGQRVMSTRNARFPESLLSFLDFDIEQIRLAFQPLADGGAQGHRRKKAGRNLTASARCLRV